jgi:hypothetical protein
MNVQLRGYYPSGLMQHPFEPTAAARPASPRKQRRSLDEGVKTVAGLPRRSTAETEPVSIRLDRRMLDDPGPFLRIVAD